MDVVITLSERGLSLTGRNTHIDDVHNGNFLGMIELLSHYDSYLQEHVNKFKVSQSSQNRLQAEIETHFPCFFCFTLFRVLSVNISCHIQSTVPALV